MNPQLLGAIAASIAMMIFTVAGVMRIRHNREQSLARVEALQALVAESGTAVSRVSAPALAKPEVFGLSATTAFDDDWDLWLRAVDHDDTPVYEDAAAREYTDAQDSIELPVPATPPARVVGTTTQFVVNVPDAAGARRWQVSFQQSGSES